MNLNFTVTECYYNSKNVIELGYVFIIRHKNADQLQSFCPSHIPTSSEGNIQTWFIFPPWGIQHTAWMKISELSYRQPKCSLPEWSSTGFTKSMEFAADFDIIHTEME